MDIIDRRPKFISYKMMAGASILERFRFFDNADPLITNVPLDILNYNFRITGRLVGSNIIIPNTVFDANELFSTTGNRNGLWLKQGTVNEIFFFFDWVMDSADLLIAPEGIYQFLLWMTDTNGFDTCIVVMQYDMSFNNYNADVSQNIDGTITIPISTNEVLVPVSVKIIG